MNERGAERAEIVDAEPVDLGEDVPLPATIKTKMVLFQRDEDPIAAFQEQEALMKVLRPAALRATLPGDWIVMGRGETAKLYLQGIGAERTAPILGLVYGPKKFTLETFPDGTVAYTCEMAIFSRRTGVVYYNVIGGRWSGDEFFDKFDCQKLSWDERSAMSPGEYLAWRMDHRLPVNPLDVKKAAETNCEVRAVSKIAGLRGLTPADLMRLAGISAGQAIAYDTGGKGGKATQTAADGAVVVPFGRNKGKALVAVTETELREYHEYATKTLAAGGSHAPGGKSARYRPSQEAFLAAVNAEIGRRLDAEDAEDAAAPESE